MVVEIVPFGGVGDYEHGELGGVQLLFIEGNQAFLFDLGSRPDHTNQFYRFPFRVSANQYLDISEELELFPSLKKIYRGDYEKFCSIHRGDSLLEDLVLSSELNMNGCVASHGHIDHVGGFSGLRADFPIHTHSLTKTILYLMQYTGGYTTNQFVDYVEQFSTTLNQDGALKFISGKEGIIPRNIKTFGNEETFNVGPFKITAYLVDHSIPGACGFIIETSSGKIGISGDLRVRGRHPEYTQKFVEALHKEKVDHLIWEGSLLHFDHEGTEEDVTSKVAELIKDRSFATVSCPPRDFDRITSLYEAARLVDRTLVISPAQALGLKLLDGANGYPKFDSEGLAVYLPRKGKGTLDRKGYESLVEKDFFDWERIFLQNSTWRNGAKELTRVSLDDLRKNQDKFLFCMPNSQMISIFTEIRPSANSIHIRCVPAPWTKEMELGESEQINVLKHFGMYDGSQIDYLTPSMGMRHMHQVHVSGHKNTRETGKILKEFTCPVLPYHTMDPRNFYPLVGAPEKLKIMIRKQRMVLD